MTRSATLVLAIMAAVLIAAGMDRASADPLTPFRYQSQAQRHCPADVVVWTRSGNDDTPGALMEAMCARRRHAPAAIAARCWGCARAVRHPFLQAAASSARFEGHALSWT